MDKNAWIATLLAVMACSSIAQPRSPNLPQVPLPRGQQVFREERYEALIASLQHAAQIALQTYDDDAPGGWERHVIQRRARLFGAAETVVLSKIDRDRKLIELAIRGTSSLDDALVDVEKEAVISAEMGVPLHSGFYSLSLDIVRLAKQLMPADQLQQYEFRLYGHSLGGAVAAIVGMILHQTEHKVAQIVTFGAPRYATNEGARRFQVLNQRTHRVVRCDDVVPFMPPPNFFGWSTNGYEASGDILLLLKPPFFDYSVGIDIERDFVRQLRTELKNAQSREKLAHGHRMSSYVAYLSSYAKFRAHSPQDKPPRSVAGATAPRMNYGRPVSYSLSLQDELCPAKLGQ